MVDKFLKQAYATHLGREPEEEGFNFWKQKLESGEMTEAEVEKAIAESPEAQARAAEEFGDFILKFEFNVNQVNAILTVLGNAPYAQVANLIGLIRSQGEPQFKATLEAKANKE